MNPVALFMPAPKPHAYEPPAHHALLFSMVVMEFWISDRAFAMLVSSLVLVGALGAFEVQPAA